MAKTRNLSKDKKSYLRKILYKILLGINIILAIALLVSYISVNISPADFMLPAFFGLAYPYILLLNFILIIIWAMNFKLEALISLIVIAVGFTHLSNYIRIGKAKSDIEGSFKVLSYNVRLFNYYEKPVDKESEKKMLDLIKKEQPDIFCLQEYFVQGSTSAKDSEVKKALGGKYYSHVKFIGISGKRYYGIVTYTKYPIIKRGDIVHPKSSSLSIYTDIIIKKDTFRIYNNHLQSYGLKRIDRTLLEELSAMGDNQTMTEIKNVSHSLSLGFVKRAEQAEKVKEHIEQSPYPVIVVGDFNDTPISYSYRKIRKGLNDAFVNAGHGAGFTYRGYYPANRIDYLLYDSKFECSSFDIIKVKYSDHYPIVGYFKKAV